MPYVSRLNKIPPFRRGFCSRGCCDATVPRTGKHYITMRSDGEVDIYTKNNKLVCIGSLYESLSESDKTVFDENIEEILEALTL